MQDLLEKNEKTLMYEVEVDLNKRGAVSGPSIERFNRVKVSVFPYLI